ncbi:MAG: hypothetical protein M3Y24_11130, partial [Acidobacteriota bacterium]|nr:hypothetical protein [Acidobacteriota bacterium]
MLRTLPRIPKRCGFAPGLPRLWENIGFAGNIAPPHPVTYTTILTVAAGACLCLLPLSRSLAAPLPAAQRPEPPAITEVRKYEGRVIESIQFDPADQPLNKEQIKNRLSLRPGSVLTEHALRQSIQNLFATGRYADLAVDIANAGSEVTLRFLTKPAYFVGRVAVTRVKQPPNTGQLTSATKLRLGAAYHQTDMDQAVDSIQNLLRQNGYYHAGINTQVDVHPETESADLEFQIAPGARARFTAPVISGNSLRSEHSIIRSTHWKRLYGLLGWQDVTEARVRQGVDRLRRDYDKRDRLHATVTVTKLDYQPATNTVQPYLEMEAGPRVIVRVEGAAISRAKLNQLVPVFQEKSVDSDLLAEGVRNITGYLQSEGYFGAAVTYQAGQASSSRPETIVYQVKLGGRHKFVQLEIVGNKYFPYRTIRERFYIEPAEFPRFPYGRFSQSYLNQDLQSIESLYVANGFRDVKLTSDIVDDYRGAKRHLSVTVKIDEGKQWCVSQLSVDGVAVRDLGYLRSRIESSPGQPFSPSSIASDRDFILNYYFGRGYLNAAFEFYETLSGASHQVALRYVVTPGEQKYVRDVLIRGLE